MDMQLGDHVVAHLRGDAGEQLRGEQPQLGGPRGRLGLDGQLAVLQLDRAAALGDVRPDHLGPVAEHGRLGRRPLPAARLDQLGQDRPEQLRVAGVRPRSGVPAPRLALPRRPRSYPARRTSPSDTSYRTPPNRAGTSAGTAPVTSSCAAPPTSSASRSRRPMSSSANTSSSASTGSMPSARSSSYAASRRASANDHDSPWLAYPLAGSSPCVSATRAGPPSTHGRYASAAAPRPAATAS